MHDRPDLNRLDLRVLRTTAELQFIEPAWTELWRSDPQATPFQNPAWLLPWWRQFGQPDLRTIAISRHGALIGLLPFYIYRDPQTATRQLLLIGAGTSDYLDGIFAPACTPEHVAQALHLLQQDESWDIGYITQLRPASKLLQALAPTLSPTPAQSCSRMPAVPIAGLPQKIRRNAMYCRNRALRSGPLELTVADESNCLAFFADFHRIHNERWQARGEAGVLDDPRVVAWHRESIPLLARQGILHFSALHHNGETIATMYALIDPPGHADRTLYIYLPALSPRHAKMSPGTLLLAYAIEHVANHGVQTIDMLRGDEPYKQLWHTEKTPTCAIELRRSSAALERAA
jgi:CelD/BcsL family acetyltransferase involved in cellulose biosynthesis